MRAHFPFNETHSTIKSGKKTVPRVIILFEFPDRELINLTLLDECPLFCLNRWEIKFCLFMKPYMFLMQKVYDWIVHFYTRSILVYILRYKKSSIILINGKYITNLSKTYQNEIIHLNKIKHTLFPIFLLLFIKTFHKNI